MVFTLVYKEKSFTQLCKSTRKMSSMLRIIFFCLASGSNPMQSHFFLFILFSFISFSIDILIIHASLFHECAFNIYVFIII